MAQVLSEREAARKIAAFKYFYNRSILRLIAQFYYSLKNKNQTKQ